MRPPAKLRVMRSLSRLGGFSYRSTGEFDDARCSRERNQMARPTGFDFPDAILLEKRILIRGAEAWQALVAARTA